MWSYTEDLKRPPTESTQQKQRQVNRELYIDAFQKRVLRHLIGIQTAFSSSSIFHPYLSSHSSLYLDLTPSLPALSFTSSYPSKATCKLVGFTTCTTRCSHIPPRLSHLQSMLIMRKHNELGLNELNEGLTRCWCLSLPWRLVTPRRAAIQYKVPDARCSVGCLCFIVLLFPCNLYLD